MSLVDLAARDVGGAVIASSDEFFAPADRMLEPSEPEWREAVYTDRGKWMDGWETRRRRREGHDWCIVRLGVPGIVRLVLVDTTHFRGNFPEAFGLDGCGVPRDAGIDELLDPDLAWEPLVDRALLSGDTRNEFELEAEMRTTFVRLRIYPDGGVARLRLAGRPVPSLDLVAPEGALPDLACVDVGGSIVAVSDDFFSHAGNLLKPLTPAGMFDGWETRRRRSGAGDWVVIRLGLPGRPRRILVDTAHFRGNAPGWISVDACLLGEDSIDAARWREIVPRRKVGPDRAHLFEATGDAEADHVRLTILPDGGIARVRVFAEPDAQALTAMRFGYLNALRRREAERFFRTACGASRWVEEMASGRPYSGPAELWEAGARAWSVLAEADWVEAFSVHPRIGERHGRQTADGEAMSRLEQGSVTGARGAVSTRLAEGQAHYEDRFGFPFIVFARGRSGEEILETLETRMQAGRREELLRAAEEQQKITASRLRRMLCMGEE